MRQYLLHCIKNYRYWVLFLLMAIVVLLLFITPTNNVPAMLYLYIVISSKVLALIIGYLTYRLWIYWENKNKL